MMLKRKMVSMLMIMVLVLSQFSMVSFAEPVTDRLLNLNVAVKQNGTTFTEVNWSTLDTKEAINLAFSFGVPVQGDGIYTENQVVKYMDTASFLLAKGFNLDSGTGPFELSFGPKKVGTLTVANDLGNKTITANIVFDGDQDVFNTNNWSNVNITFNANIKYNRAVGNVEGGLETFEFLSKTFDIMVPALPVDITGEKTGIRVGQFIDWKVKLEGKKGATPADVVGYIFKDNISNVGTYELGSFKVNTTDNATTATLINPDFLADTTELTYTFPSGSSGEQYIFYRTKITDAVFQSNGSKTIRNTGKLFLGAIEKWSDDADITFVVEWIKKEGAVTMFDATTNSGQITWSITANQLGAYLTNAVITDLLSDKLNFNSATLKTYSSGAWSVPVPITPTDSNSKYILGTISTPVLLTIITEVNGTTYNIGHTLQSIENTATIIWDGLGNGIGSSKTVGIGLNPIDKTAGTYNKSSHTIPWTVEVKKSDVGLNLRVMDLLVYGSSGFDVTKIGSLYTIEDNAANGLNQVSDADFKSLTPSYNQKYKTGSFILANGQELKVYTISKAGVAVADLLVMTETGAAGISVSVGSKFFTFETIVTNPDFYAKNGNKTVRNDTALFMGSFLINKDNVSVSYDSSILKKDMLKRENALDPDFNKNTVGSNITSAFNYADKTVVYRLHVNANQLTDLTNDLTTNDGQALGTITLTDQLPAGWEFVEIETGKMFKIYEGTGNADGTVTAGAEPGNVGFITANFLTPGQVEFTLTELKWPYVILLKAKPNNATIAGYFDSNKTTIPRNNATIVAANWSTGSTTYQDVSITSQILGKTLVPAAGVLTWTVEYKPYALEHTGIRIEDTIPQDIELRTNSEGALSLIDDNIVVTKLKLKPDGSYETDGNVPLVLGASGNLSYNSTTRVMTFRIPEGTTDVGYRMVYKTDIIGNTGTAISNSVKLIGSSVTSQPVASNYSVQDADASATMTRSGWVEITKKDGMDNALLSSARFEIRTVSGNSFRNGITAANGKVILRGLPIGQYTLLETNPPTGYNLDNKTYTVTVSQNSGTFVTSVDGKTGTDSNRITIQNIKTGTLGTLKLSKILTGNATNPTKDFVFTINVVGLNGIYEYVGHGGKVNGSLVFTAGTAAITLKGGEAVSIMRLPKDLNYTVLENDYRPDGYVTTQTGETGIIQADAVLEVLFTNARNISSGGGTPTPPPVIVPPLVVPPVIVPPVTMKPNPPVVRVETPVDTPKGGVVDVPEGGTIVVISTPTNGTVVVKEDGTWTYTPTKGFIGKDQFTVMITNPDGSIEENIIDIDVEEVPLASLPLLPKTGEVPPLLYTLFGLMISGLGVYLLKRGQRKQQKN